MAHAGFVTAPLATARPDFTAFVKKEPGGARRLELTVTGAHCAHCISRIERAACGVSGVDSARLNLSTARLSVAWSNPRVSPDAVVNAVEAEGYAVRPYDPGVSARQTDEHGRFLLTCMAVAGFASMNVMLLSVSVWAGFGEMGPGGRTFFYWAGALIAIPAALFSGQPFFRSAWEALSRGHANMDVPISLAVLLTLGVSLVETIFGGQHAYFDSVVSLLFLLLAGRYLDHHLRQRARQAARDLLAMQAVSVRRMDPSGAATSIPARDVRVGDAILLAPGERAPVNGVVVQGASDVDAAMVTGESAPIAAAPGAAIMAGVVNLTKPLVLRATSTTDTSLLADLSRLIEQGEQRRSRFVRIADKAAGLYVPIVHTVALATFLGWLVLGGSDVRPALLAAVSVLIITCPCALGLAVPAVQVVATGRLFKHGVYVRSGDALERLAQVDCVMLDKTGTVTLGKPCLVNGSDVAPATMARAAQLARASRHPFARALAAYCGPGPIAADIQEIQGQGVEGLLDGRRARLGKRAFAAPSSEGTEAGESEIWFSDGVESPVRFAFLDAPRPDAAAVIAALEQRGLEPVILSGDHAGAVAAAAKAVGAKRFEANLSPADKVARIKAAQSNGRRVLMIGDGLNDAAALASAHAAISPGAAADATQASADIVFQGEGLGAVLEALDVARSARARVRENLAFSAIYNVCAIPIAVAGLVTPLIAALAMAGSSLAVTLNALRVAPAQRRRP